MDTFEGDPGSPASLHRYLYTGASPVDRTDPSGRDFDLGSLSTSIGAVGALASSAFIAAQNVAYNIYFNLYRVPQIIDQVSTGLLFLQGAIAGAFFAKNAIETVVQNLQDSNTIFSSAPSEMGNENGGCCRRQLAKEYAVVRFLLSRERNGLAAQGNKANIFAASSNGSCPQCRQ